MEGRLLADVVGRFRLLAELGLDLVRVWERPVIPGSLRNLQTMFSRCFYCVRADCPLGQISYIRRGKARMVRHGWGRRSEGCVG